MPNHPFLAFFAELKRRRVLRVALVYGAAAWVVIEVSSTVLPALYLPAWTVTFIVVLALLGFPVALVLAWVFDLTPEGDIVSDPLAPESFRGLGAALMRDRRLLIAGAVGVLVLAGLAFWLSRPGGPPRAAAGTGEAAPASRIAVLYFDDNSADHDLRYLADGLTEGLIDELSAVPALKVISESGVAPYRDAATPPDSIAAALHVGMLVEGSVARAGDSLRVTVQLTDPATATVLHGQTFTAAWGDDFGLMDRLVRDVSTFLRQQLGEEITVQEWQAGTSSVQAWKLVQRAQGSVKDAASILGAGDVAAARRALSTADSLLAAAAALDPHWATPAVLRGETARRQYILARIGPSARTPAQWLATGLQHARQALSIDPGNARALELRGVLEYDQWLSAPPAGPRADSLLQRARTDLGAAVAADPMRARAWSKLSSILLASGDFAEAHAAAEHAYRADAYLEDVGTSLVNLWLTSFELGQDDQAHRWCAELGRREGGWSWAYCRLALLAWASPEPTTQAPWPVTDSLTRDEPATVRTQIQPRLAMLAAGVLIRENRPDSARAVIAAARAAAPDDPNLLYLEAADRVLLRDDDAAVQLLRRYVRAAPNDAPAKLRSRLFARLRTRPDFPKAGAVESAAR